jgi:glyceraldehyde-3-phosphate dehydrogenase/erythrose-4-phosphate dehydrogenase
MVVKLGINGFGRIGRLVMRAALDNPDSTALSLLLLDVRFGLLRS